MNTTTVSDPGFGDLDGILPDIEALYKDVHAHPELSMREERTAQLAAERLRAAGFEVETGVGKTGVVGVLRNGEGPTVMLRADMDALPIKEDTGLPYASAVTANRFRSVTCVDMTFTSRGWPARQRFLLRREKAGVAR